MLIRTACNTLALISPSANHIQTTTTRSNDKAGRENDGRGNDEKKKLEIKVMKKTKLMRAHSTIRFFPSLPESYANARTKCAAAQPHRLTLLAFSLKSSFID
ncbi:hypothetical protein WUBG_02312 [Wuchereria bancrofti]|uniref:Uncharacterized protein n=1 Tax=Wuchereria bancrofti TaxID=6293 RepID=J9EX54_WUCBA|nr:hypothetical protein WUBG_02312 [Wuchereria bancrofti]